MSLKSIEAQVSQHISQFNQHTFGISSFNQYDVLGVLVIGLIILLFLVRRAEVKQYETRSKQNIE